MLLSNAAGTMDAYAQAGTGIHNIKATYAVEIDPEAHIGSNTKHVIFDILKNTISSNLHWNIAEPALLTLHQDFQISILHDSSMYTCT
jgi:hypothetical protein